MNTEVLFLQQFFQKLKLCS